MPKVELTDRFCRSAKVGEGRKTDYFDEVVKGLCFRVSAGGAKCFYQVYSRPGDGKARAWLKLGHYPELTLSEARQRARDGRGEVSDGVDLVKEKKAEAASQTVADLVESFIVRHASKNRSGGEVARRLRKNVSGRDGEGKKTTGASSGVIGDIKLSTLHRRDLTKAIDAVVDRGATTEAVRVYEDLRTMIRWARGRGDLDANIMEGMQPPAKLLERDRVLTADEIKSLWGALDDADMWEGSRRVLRLCLATAARVGEIAGMERSELDLDRRLWVLPAQRVKNGETHVLPLSEMSVGIIRDQIAAADKLAKRMGRDPSPFIFPGVGGRGSIGGAAIAKALRRQLVTEKGQATIFGIAPFTAHDLRRTAATHMEELGVNPFVIGHVLNHASITKASITSRVYARHDYLKEKTEALDLWAERLAGIIDGRVAAVPSLRVRAG